MTIYSVRCLLHNHFTPSYENYSSYDELTLLVKKPDFYLENTLVDQEKWQSYLADFVEESYLNADGVQLQAKLFHIVGIQEMDDVLKLPSEVGENYREFYQCNRRVTEAEFLKLYYFDDSR